MFGQVEQCVISGKILMQECRGQWDNGYLCEGQRARGWRESPSIFHRLTHLPLDTTRVLCHVLDFFQAFYVGSVKQFFMNTIECLKDSCKIVSVLVYLATATLKVKWKFNSNKILKHQLRDHTDPKSRLYREGEMDTTRGLLLFAESFSHRTVTESVGIKMDLIATRGTGRVLRFHEDKCACSIFKPAPPQHFTNLSKVFLSAKSNHVLCTLYAHHPPPPPTDNLVHEIPKRASC